MLRNFLYLFKVIFLLAILLFNGGLAGLMFYVDEHKDCECGRKWQRNVIKIGSLVVCGFALLAYLTPFVKIFRMIPLIGGLILLAAMGLIGFLLYTTKQYLDEVAGKNCVCKLKDKNEKVFRNIHRIFGYGSISTLAIVAAVLVIVLFYLF